MTTVTTVATAATMTARFSRRRALGLALAGTVGVAVGATGWVLSGTSRNDSSGAVLRGIVGQPMAQPAVLTSRDGVLEVQLTAAPGVRLAGRDTAALGYNGTSPGPTLHVQPGDLLRVRLVNQLRTPTNLHTHGLHVSPDGNGDNPFISAEPGTSVDYAYRIPVDHPVGTFWYHPHLHGHVADQVFGGLVGALLVGEGAELPVTEDRLLVITDTTLDGSGQVVGADMMSRVRGREGRLVLVNGQQQPVITAATGTVERWRIVNGCVARVLVMYLTEHRLSQIALDGALLPAPIDQDRLVLAPGNRADVLVRPTAAGRYVLVTESFQDGRWMGGPPGSGPPGMGSGPLGMGSGPPGMGSGHSGHEERTQRARGADTPGVGGGSVVLATLMVTGATAPAVPLPATLPAVPVPQAPVNGHRELTFAMGMGMGEMRFTIDGLSFDPERTDQTVPLGHTEDWTITNTSPVAHPFHLHVWRFQVLATSSGEPSAGLLQDVVLVPAGGWARIRIPFTDYPGRSVYHCHILDHEDLGMMATVVVQA